MLFKLKPSVHITKGKYRDLLCEIQTQYVSFIPQSLTKFLKQYDGKIDLETIETQYKATEYYDVYKEYMDYLKNNKLLIFTSENKSVQKIKFEYVEKSTFNTMIIYIDFKCDHISYEIYKDIIQKYDIISLEFRLLNLADIDKYLNFTSLLNNTNVSSIHLVDLQNCLSRDTCESILEKCIKTIKITKFECNSERTEIVQNKFGAYSITYKTNNILDARLNVKVENSHANLRFISESQVRNVYFNGKIVIGYDGKFFNDEFMEGKSFGHILDSNISKDSIGSEFDVFKISKCVIEKCKECELRNLCIDRRIPKLKENGGYYYDSDCGYDLEKGQWIQN